MTLLGRLAGWFGGGASSSYLVGLGDTYGPSTSARESLPAVVRGISLLSGDIARIGVRVIDRHGSPIDSPVLSLLSREANPSLTGSAWRSWMVATSLTHGTAHSFVQRDGVGEPVALWPIAPGRVQIEWSGMAPDYKLDGRVVDQYSIISLLAGPGDSGNPYACRSPLARCAPSLSLAVLQERVATALAESGRVGKISITHPGTLSTTAKMDLLDAYTRKHVTPEGASRPLVLDEGVRVERVGDGSLPGLLDERRHAIMEVGRALGIPPQMLYQGDSGALSSQIEMQRQYVEGTVAAWCDRFSTAMTVRMLPPGQRVQLLAQDLTRGNLRDTASALKDLSYTGALLVADAREMLGLPAAAHNAEIVHKANTPGEEAVDDARP